MAIINYKTLTQRLEEAKNKSEAISAGSSVLPSQSAGRTYIHNQQSFAYGTGPLKDQYPATPSTTPSSEIPYMPSQAGTQAGVQAGTQLGTQTGGEQENPIMKFNLAIMDMLTKAQEASDPTKLYEQQRALQRTQLGKVSEMTPEQLQVLSPSQQEAIRSGKSGMLEPEIDAVAARIKSQDYRLRNFESMLDSARALGKDFLDTVKIKPDQEIVAGYIRMMEMGGSISSVPMEVRNDIISKMSPESWQKHDAAEVQQKTQMTSAGKTTTPATFTSQELRKLEQAGIDPNNRQEALDFLYEKGTETFLSQDIITTIAIALVKKMGKEDAIKKIQTDRYITNQGKKIELSDSQVDTLLGIIEEKYPQGRTLLQKISPFGL